MLIKKHLSLHRIIKITWKIDLAMLVFCTITYAIDIYGIPNFKLPIAYPALMGTAIAFFIGFTNSQAYERWWEARKIWGNLVNDSRTWSRSLLAHCKDRETAKIMIRRHIAFLYALIEFLRKEEHLGFLKHLNEEDKTQLDLSHHIPNAILNLQANDLQRLRQNQQVDDFTFLGLYNSLQNICNSMGQSERINNTIFPVTYIYFTELFIWLFIALITMGTSNFVGLASVLLGWVMGFVFNVIHLNGMSLMNPFVYGPSGVPISSIANKIEMNLLHAMGEKNLPETGATLTINNEYMV
jgi:putative membrane protein